MVDRSLYELDKAITEAQARWDGIGQAVAREIHSLEVERSLIVKGIAGCCGELYLDGPYCKYVHVICPAVARGCRMASVSEIRSVLKEVESFEPLA